MDVLFNLYPQFFKALSQQVDLVWAKKSINIWGPIQYNTPQEQGDTQIEQKKQLRALLLLAPLLACVYISNDEQMTALVPPDIFSYTKEGKNTSTLTQFFTEEILKGQKTPIKSSQNSEQLRNAIVAGLAAIAKELLISLVPPTSFSKEKWEELFQKATQDPSKCEELYNCLSRTLFGSPYQLNFLSQQASQLQANASGQVTSQPNTTPDEKSDN